VTEFTMFLHQNMRRVLPVQSITGKVMEVHPLCTKQFKWEFKQNIACERYWNRICKICHAYYCTLEAFIVDLKW